MCSTLNITTTVPHLADTLRQLGPSQSQPTALLQLDEGPQTVTVEPVGGRDLHLAPGLDAGGEVAGGLHQGGRQAGRGQGDPVLQAGDGGLGEKY